MGLFSFLKKAGAGLLRREASKKDASAASAEEMRRRKIAVMEGMVAGMGIEIDNLAIDVQDDVLTVHGQAQSQADKEKVILALGNVEGIATVDDRISVVASEPESVFYQVQSGDSLSKIAKAHYGDPMKYMAIFEANQPMLKDPNLIYPGQMLRIPPL